MPEYLAPGVFVEEVSFRGKSIAGVGTSVAGMVGPMRTGPLRGKPEPVTSYEEFKRTFGDEEALDFGGGDVLNHCAIAAKAFFDNGGKQLYPVRTIAGANSVDVNGDGSDAARAVTADANDVLNFEARFPGRMGNYWLELRWREGESIGIGREQVAVPLDGDLLLLEVTGLDGTARSAGRTTPPDAAFPMDVTAIVRRDGAHYEIVGELVAAEAADENAYTSADFNTLAGDATPQLATAGLADAPGRNVIFRRIRANGRDGGAIANDTFGRMAFDAGAELDVFTGGVDVGDATTELLGVFVGDGANFRALDALNDSIDADLDIPVLVVLSNQQRLIELEYRNFDLDVRTRNREDNPGEVVYTYGDISVSSDDDRRIAEVLTATPDGQAARVSPISCTVADDADTEGIVGALISLFDADRLNPNPERFVEPRSLISMGETTAGTDGPAVLPIDYSGESHIVMGSTGFEALAEAEDVAIVMTPAAAADPTNHLGIAMAMRTHCARMRYRVGIVDARRGMSISEVRDLRARFGSDSRLALYYPWVVTPDPTSERRPSINVPPSGFVAGVYAKTDVDRGVHKAPANVIVQGALRFAQDINRFQQELLNPNGVNCLRFIKRSGNVVWGGRTLSTDVEWQYVNVRRYFLYLERSIETSTQWAVFEPNGPKLWDNVRSAVEDFLYNEWFNGKLLGGSPKDAYFVRCDRSTMTQADIDNGRMVCLVGVSPLRPAEFVIFRVGQITADA